MTDLLRPRAALDDLHRRYANDRDCAAGEALVLRYAGLARSLAKRFARNPAEIEECVQVAMCGLVAALQRFDADRGFEFSTFAQATIAGELKRFRRDTGWNFRVPRSLQEAYLAVAATVDDLGHQLGRSPTVVEIAAAAGLEPDDVVEALDVGRAQRMRSFDEPSGVEDSPVAATIGEVDRGFVAVDSRNLVEELLGRLPERDQQIVRLRFTEELSQSEIASRLGISQMQVSRLLRSALDRMRAMLDTG